MYKFSFANSVAGKATEVTREVFHQLIADERVQELCAQIASTTDPDARGQLKRRLPAFCWHAWFDQGKRANQTAHPSGLIMLDVDHVQNPRALFDSMLDKARTLGLLAAHVTPSTEGLRLVFRLPAGMDLVQGQAHFAQELGLQNVDAVTKDLARLSFCVPEAYWLSVDEDALFDGECVECQMPSCAQPQPQQQPVAKPPSAEPPSHSSQPPSHRSQPFSAEYEGIPYPALVEALQDQLGGVPAHGSRNNFIFSMAAHLRYVCNDDPAWIAQILPTYGESPERWQRTIQSACQRAQYKVMPQLVKRAIDNARLKQLALRQPCDPDGNALPPAMPKRLPRLIAHLVKNVPEVCRPAVAHAVFPALGAHLHGVKFGLVDGTQKEATFMCVTIAKQSSGKSAVNKPIDYIIADMVERDEVNRRREQEWKDASANKSANKEKPKRPDDLCVQVLVSDMTNAAFVQRMKDAGGKYLYTNLEELDLLRQLQTNGTKDVGKIICLCFDNGSYGQERVGTQSVTARVALRWNWNASSTIQKGVNFFRGRMVDGTLSRVNFCTIIPDKSKPFVYGQYDEQYAAVLKPYITNLNLANGVVECPQALRLARQMQEQCAEEGALSDDEMYQDLSYRAVTIAYLKAMVLYIAHDMTWSKEIADFAQWSLRYDLWCKSHFFAEQMAEEKAHEVVKKVPGRQNLLELLPNPFTLQDAREVRQLQGLHQEGCRQMLTNWTHRGYIELDPTLGVYRKMK